MLHGGKRSWEEVRRLSSVSTTDKIGATIELVAGIATIVLVVLTVSTPLGLVVGVGLGLVAVVDALSTVF